MHWLHITPRMYKDFISCLVIEILLPCLTMFVCFRFEFLAYTVFLKYQSSLLFTREEFAVVVVGPMTNVVVFSLLIMLSWAAQRVFGSFPNILSRFVVAFGIETALDPILITIVDMAMGRYMNQEGNTFIDL